MADKAKTDMVEELRVKFQRVKGMILVDFRGLNVRKMTELRAQLREAGIEYLVVKNTLAKRAAQGTEVEKAADLFAGPTAVAYSYQDELAPAKVLTSFIKKQGPKERPIQIKGGVLDGAAVRPDEVAAVANLPAKPVLLSHLLSQLQAPAANLVGVLQGVLRDFLYVLKALEEKKGPADAFPEQPDGF